MNISCLRRRALASLACLAAAYSLCAALPAHAADAYPSKPITLMVAYPAGGDSDVLARLLGDKLTGMLKQPVVVENRTGAAGMIGTSFVAKAKPDGYTLLVAPNTVVISPLVIQAAGATGYDVTRDLTPIVQLGRQSLFVVVTGASGVRSAQALVAGARAGAIPSYASPGNGSPMHILGELFNKSTGVKIAQVPSRGSVPAVADMVGGHVQMMYSTLGPVSQFLPSGKLVPVAVADSRRSSFLPDVPTLAEQGIKDAEVGAWQAVLGPKGLPPELVQRLNAAINEVLKMPDVIERLAALAVEPAGGSPADLARLIANDHAKYGRLVREFNIRTD
jgi:tripartite-type tricarboxylate transporter receptor subunit TctC